MKHFFISYSRTDAEFGENLINRIRAQGFETWVDTEQLLPGHDWRTAIDEAIRASAAVIVVMTPAAKVSEYVTYEWAYALGAGVAVIPVLLDRTDLHPRLAALQYLEFTVPIHLRPWERLFDCLGAVMPQKAPQAPSKPIDIQKLNQSAELIIRFDQEPPFVWVYNSTTSYRIGIFNKGPAVAENVEVWLDAITPFPRQLFRRDFPYRVAHSGYEMVEGQGCAINPERQELFEIARSWISGEEGRLIVDGIDTKTPLRRFPGAFEMERDESWRLTYRIASANGMPANKDIIVIMEASGDTLSVHLGDSN